MRAPAPSTRGAARCRRHPPDRSAPRAATIAPDSSRVMSSRLAMKRLSRSASSWIVRDQFVLRASRRAVAIGFEAGRRAEDRGERRAQIVRDRGQQRRAQPLGLRRQLGAVDILREIDALDGERRLVGQAHRAAGADRATGAGRAGRCRGRRRRRRRARCASAGTAAWRPAACRRRGRPRANVPSPFRGREIGLVEHVLRRIAGAHGHAVAFRQQQHHAHLQHRRDLIGRRPQQIVERDDARELAAEEIEIFGRLGALARRHRLVAHPRRQIAGDHRDDREEEQRDDVLADRRW